MANQPLPFAASTTRRTALGLALGLPLGAACSLTLDLSESQPCQSAADCMYTTGQGTCVDGLCQPPDSASTTTSSLPPTETGPATSETMTAPPLDSSTSGTDTSEGVTTEPVPCTVNSECGETERCGGEGTCVSLVSAECDVVLWPDDDRDNVVFVGSIMPTGSLFTELVQPLENALQLAIEDFNDITALQGERGVAWIGCDSTAGAGAAVTAATHLRDNADVRAIVGPVFSEAVRDVAEQVTIPANIFLISPAASAPSLSDLDDDNLVWRVIPNDVFQANAIVDRFTGDIDPLPQRMLVLNKDDSYGNELQQLVITDLVNDLAPAEVYFASYAGPETFADQDALLAAYGEALGLALGQPGIAQNMMGYDSPDDHYTHILIIGTSEAEALILSYLGIWGQLYSFAPFPIITVTHGAVPTMEDIVTAAADIPELEPLVPLLQTNLRGTSPDIFDAANFTAFNVRYKIRFNDEDALTSSSLAYDAGMAVMLAMSTIAAEEEITGDKIAVGMGRLNDPAGVPISFGDPVNVFVQAARNALVMGDNVDLRGVSGALDWNPDNGDVRADVLGWNVGNGLMGEPISLTPYCRYVLNDPPAADGAWLSLSNNMPPCN